MYDKHGIIISVNHVINVKGWRTKVPECCPVEHHRAVAELGIASYLFGKLVADHTGMTPVNLTKPRTP